MNNKLQTVIITGADGFIGQHLAPLAIKKIKKRFSCFVGSSETDLEKRGVKILKQNGVKFSSVDLITGKNLNKLPESPELIIHLAANTDTSTPNHKVNDLGTKNLFNALKLSGPKTHFIYTSTTVLFSGRKNADKPITNKTAPKPTNEYGRTKLAAEKFLISACIKNKIPLTIIRINTVYGNDPRKYKMFASLKTLILSNSIISRLNWPGLTSIVHVKDVAEIILKLSKKPPKPGHIQTFILYSENLTLSEISKLMHQKLKVDYHPINLPGYFWKICAYLRRFIPLLENLLPSHIYNMFWRAGLIVDHVIYCKSGELFKMYPGWKPRKLKDTIQDTLV